MNLFERQLEREAGQYAKRLLGQAAKNEPEITADLQKIALANSAELSGLENKFKTEESLTRKIVYQATKTLEYSLIREISDEKAVKETFSQLAEQQNDALRYTVVLSFEKYVSGFEQFLKKLKQKGYEVLENKIWNAWKNIGTPFDRGYRGINITAISSQGQKFELQFHTEESFRLKIKIHKLYKEARLQETPRKRRTNIAKIMIDLAKEIRIPQGVTKL